MAKRVPILYLPLVPSSSRLTNCLLPDPITPTPSSLLSVSDSSASLLRRSRGVGEGSHFSYVTPLVLGFPYDLEEAALDGEKEAELTEEEFEKLKKKVEEMTEEEKQKYGTEKAKERMENLERMIRPYELDPEAIPPQGDSTLRGYLPSARTRQTYPSARLLAISKATLDECLPHLDVGDALQWIKSKSGKDDPDCYTSGPMAKLPSEEDSGAFARYQLSDYLSGRLVGAMLPNLHGTEVEEGAEAGVAEAKHQQMVRTQGRENVESDLQRWERRSAILHKRQSGKKEWTGYAPWANNYSGHQFGVWAGQLGDGRAVTLMETQNPDTEERWEIQLKGAGRTPYSRFADGLATLKSSVREFLASEAIARLGIPTSRALALISIKDVAVVRERRESAGITTRLAPIWTRIGSFEHHSSRKEWESVRLLGEFVCKEGYHWQLDGPEAWAKRLVRECAVRNAKMIAGWQTIGFMHGVMNTDNVNLMGITVDYGPFAMMDVYQADQICNKSDGEARYTFRNQPTMGLYAIEKLFDSLLPLIGFEEDNGRCLQPGELVALSKDEIDALSKKGKESAEEEIKNLFMDTLLEEWKLLWLKKLAIQTSKEDDRYTLIDPLLHLLQDCDFTSTLRSLSRVTDFLDRPDEFAKVWLDWDVVPSYAKSSKEEHARTWLNVYVDRLKEEGRSAESIKYDLDNANPAFVLRNWVTDEVAQRLAQDDDTDFLETVLHLCFNPFEDPKDKEAKRLCSLGMPLTGALPSCSS
ncbi:hypothetical protein CBS101457_006445 [Exobasidium rhododendri]|nr:hypothetical protein CBS101457_006445 [Exobasidium rhododendri]